MEPEHERRATGVGGSEEEKVEGGGGKKKNRLINVWCERGAATDALTVNSQG